MLLIDTTAWYGANAPAEWRARAAKARSEGLASMAEFPGNALVRRSVSGGTSGAGSSDAM